jgi:hypothetical protein
MLAEPQRLVSPIYSCLAMSHHSHVHLQVLEHYGTQQLHRLLPGDLANALPRLLTHFSAAYLPEGGVSRPGAGGSSDSQQSDAAAAAAAVAASAGEYPSLCLLLCALLL